MRVFTTLGLIVGQEGIFVRPLLEFHSQLAQPLSTREFNLVSDVDIPRYPSVLA